MVIKKARKVSILRKSLKSLKQNTLYVRPPVERDFIG